MAILAAAGLLPAVVAGGQKFPVGPVFQVDSNPNFPYAADRHGPDVAANAAGGFVVVWEAAGPGYTQEVRGQVFDESGGPVGEGEFSATGAHRNYGYWSLAPAVEVGNAGEFVVVWREAKEDESSYLNSDIFARRFTRFGNPSGQKFRVNTLLRGESPESPKVAVDGAGGFVVVWGTYFNAHPVYARRYEANGNPLGPEFAASTPPRDTGFSDLTGDSDAIEVAAGAGGEFMVVWKSDDRYGYPANNAKIFGRTYDDAGTATTEAEFFVHSDLTEDTYRNYPGIAADGAGGFVVVRAELGSYDFGVRARRFAASGGALGSELVVTTAQGYLTPKVATDAAGNFVVVWQEGFEIRGRQFDGSGAPAGPEFLAPIRPTTPATACVSTTAPVRQRWSPATRSAPGGPAVGCAAGGDWRARTRRSNTTTASRTTRGSSACGSRPGTRDEPRSSWRARGRI
jgi:hypothetical protein